MRGLGKGVIVAGVIIFLLGLGEAIPKEEVLLTLGVVVGLFGVALIAFDHYKGDST